jgi:hypothetical protein
MTTIAYKDGVMAADSQATDYSTISRVQKLWRLPDGGVVAYCGEARKGYAGVKWMLDGEKDEPPSIEEAYLIIARPDGTIWVAEGQFPAFPIMSNVIAHGCGRDGALMAMSQGMGAVDAVLETCKNDAFSSAPVHSMEVCKTHAYPGMRTHVRPVKAKKPATRKRK